MIDFWLAKSHATELVVQTSVKISVVQKMKERETRCSNRNIFHQIAKMY